MYPAVMNGRLIQKIQRHVVFCAKTPPMMGPVTEPTALEDRGQHLQESFLISGYLPHPGNYTNPLSSEPQRHQIGHNDLSHSDDASTTNTLKRSTN
jgi:hypothetical protein